jgi:hypothetical protein
LSGGAVAGIAIGCSVFVALLVGILVYCLLKKKYTIDQNNQINQLNQPILPSQGNAIGTMSTQPQLYGQQAYSGQPQFYGQQNYKPPTYANFN